MNRIMVLENRLDGIFKIQWGKKQMECFHFVNFSMNRTQLGVWS